MLAWRFKAIKVAMSAYPRQEEGVCKDNEEGSGDKVLELALGRRTKHRGE
jgi:hypothetical protein